MTEGAVRTEAGSLFQYLTILTENADPLLRQWLARRVGGRKNNIYINILKAREYLEGGN